MEINYQRYLELNKEAMTEHGQASAFYAIQSGVERYLWGDELSESQKKFLVDLGVLFSPTETVGGKSVIEPFKFNSDGNKETH